MCYRDDARRLRADRRSRPDGRFVAADGIRLMAASVVCWLVMIAASPVDAQESTSSTATTAPSTTAPSTTAPSTTVPSTTAPTTSEPSTTAPSTTEPSSSSTADETSATSADATTITTGPEDSSSTETTDPLIDEAPADDPLDPNVTVPPPTGADTQVELAPVPILWSSVREAEAKWADAQSAKIEAIVEVRTLRIRAKELVVRQRELEADTQLTISELAAATERLRARAVRGFVQASSGNATGTEVGTQVFRSRDVLIGQRKTRLVAAAVDVDQISLDELAELRSALGTSALELVRRSGVIDSSIRRSEAAVIELDTAVDQARIELEAFKAGSEIYVDGVVFPIAGPYSVPLINSFGFPRMPGTPDAHAHEGIDIFAPRGTPLVAAERGVVGRVGIGRLGGLKLWLRGESGADWYYAHLDGFAPGLHNGQVVEAGELLGYVGNTGNAVGTPPHLHLEIHPNGGAAVNPYPLMKVVSDLDLKSVVDSTHPGYRYQPVIVSQPVQPTTSTTSAPAIDPATSPSTAPSTTAASSTSEPSTSDSPTSDTPTTGPETTAGQEATTTSTVAGASTTATTPTSQATTSGG